MKDKIIGIIIVILIAVGYYILFLPDNTQKVKSPKEIAFETEALVLTKNQSWDQIGNKIINIFRTVGKYQIQGDKDNWSFYQYTDGDGVSIWKANYRKWRQCIWEKSNKQNTICADQEWVYHEDTQRWELININFGKNN